MNLDAKSGQTLLVSASLAIQNNPIQEQAQFRTLPIKLQIFLEKLSDRIGIITFAKVLIHLRMSVQIQQSVPSKNLLPKAL